MSEEIAFLEHLKNDPSDDVTRMVYADWLEERGDLRAAFLRDEKRLAALSDTSPEFANLQRDLGERAKALPAWWLEAAGRRWDVWLIDFPANAKLGTIKAVREWTGCG